MLAQEAFQLENVPSLVDHQSNAKKTATLWINTIREALYQANTNLIAFSNKFVSLHKVLYDLAGDLNKGDNRKTFLQGLQLLINDIERKTLDAQSTKDRFNDWLLKLIADKTNIQSDLEVVQRLDGADSDLIKSYQTQLAAYNTVLLPRALCSCLFIPRQSIKTSQRLQTVLVGGLIIAVGHPFCWCFYSACSWWCPSCWWWWDLDRCVIVFMSCLQKEVCFFFLHRPIFPAWAGRSTY